MNQDFHKNMDRGQCRDCLKKKRCKKNRHVDLCDCKDFHRINFAGLRNDFNQKLRKCKNCEFDMRTVAGSRKRGKTHQLGIDFVDLKERNGRIVTVLRDKIDHINWLDKNCKCDKCLDRHCDCHKHHDCDCNKNRNYDWCKHCDDDWRRHHDCDCHKHHDDDWRKHDDCDCHKHHDHNWCKHHDDDWRKHHDCDCHKHHNDDWHKQCHCKRNYEWW